MPDKFPDQLKEVDGLFTTPIFHCHGGLDRTVSVEWGRFGNQTLNSLGFVDAKFRFYDDLHHWLHDEEINDMKSFISSCFK